MVAPDSLRAFTMARRSPLTRVMPALSMAMSVPVPIAMPTSARASAGASLMPSPAIATTCPSAWSVATAACFPAGVMPARTSSMPSSCATARAVVSLSPVSITMRRPAVRRASRLSTACGLTGSRTATKPAGPPSIATHITVAPCARIDSARAAAPASRSMPDSPSSASFPTSTPIPPMRPRTPRPVSDSNASASSMRRPRASAPSVRAFASGCSLARSMPAARASHRSCGMLPTETAASSTGRPSVRVPVLSITRVSARSRRWSDFASRISTPSRAPRPTPVITDTGVASPSAHGQAMMSTDTAATSALASEGAGPNVAQAAKVTAATITTAGTNQPAITSAVAWIGARDRPAMPTSAAICATRVSAPTRSARMVNAPIPFTVPPVTGSPALRSTGIGSPVTIDSSMLVAPSSTMPSVGTRSPGRTRSRSPTVMASMATSSSVPSGAIRRAMAGARVRRRRMASPVRARARSSSTCPRMTRVTMTAAASK